MRGMMKKLIGISILVASTANASFYVQGGLGMMSVNDAVISGAAHSASTAYSGQSIFSGSAALGFSYNDFFVDIGTWVAPQSSKYLQGWSEKSVLMPNIRIGSMMHATKTLKPYLFGVGTYYKIKNDVTSHVLVKKKYKAKFGYGAGVGLRGDVGKHSYYDFSYSYHQVGQVQIGTYFALPVEVKPKRTVFQAAIGYKF